MEAKVLHNLMSANDDFAEEIRAFRQDRGGIPMLNLIGGPGCGKTALLEKTIVDLKDEVGIAVIEGDIATPNDADRIARAGAQSIQINTHGSCHLDANLVLKAMLRLDLEGVDLIVVENVGNLVCPAEFDVGEDVKVGMLSVTEGEDKPTKYPLLFRESAVVLLSKVDLLPYVPFDVSAFEQAARDLNGPVDILHVSATGEAGITPWTDWIRTFVTNHGDMQRGEPVLAETVVS
jgi:hydrogenase nickel incorporation protein HypB